MEKELDGNVYQSTYLREKYNVEFPYEFGKLLEWMTAENISKEYQKVQDYPVMKKLHVYLAGSQDIVNLSLSMFPGYFILQDEETQQYFFAKWLVDRLESCHSEGTETFIDYLEQYCRKIIINDICINFLNKFLNTKDEYKSYLQDMFNELIQNKYFKRSGGEAFFCIFINLWKILRIFFHQSNPVKDENKQEFALLLRKLSGINESFDGNTLKHLNLSYLDFTGADLSETCFYHVNLSHCNFKSANLDAVSWSGSDLSCSDFNSAFMECSNLEDCDCRNSTFINTHLLSSVVSGADFSNASLENANFMECDADRIKVKGLRVDDKTAFNGSDFRYVEWEGIDISGLSISDEQVNSFWEVVNYTRNTILYDAKFKRLDNEAVQEVIFKELKSSSDRYLKTARLSLDVPDIFISYASEERNEYAFPLYKALKEAKNHKGDKITIWFDEEYLTMGDKLRQSIESVIRNCKLAVIIFSENYARKGWTRYEILRILQESRERGLHVLLISTSEQCGFINLYQESCCNVPKSNQYQIADTKSFIAYVVNKAVNLFS